MLKFGNITDADGNLSFSFNSSDRLSSYAVQLFAHDRDMNCASIRETILITLPLKLTLMPPACLYEGDSWRIRAELSSTASGDMSGYALLSLFAGDAAGKDALFQLRLDDVRVAAGSSVALDFGTLPQEIYASLAASRRATPLPGAASLRCAVCTGIRSP